MSRYWSDVARGLTPYVPGEQPKLPNLVKLNTNENPYGPSPKALEAMRQQVADSLRLYPDPHSDALREAIAQFHGVEMAQVFVGNGSDEVLAHTFLALLKHDQPVLFPDITYSFYPVYCGLYQIDYREIALTDSFEIHVDDYFVPNGGIIFPNPNAPTGRLLALSEIERLLQANSESVVVVDEAYIGFGGESAVGLVKRYPQLLVVHTLSKSHSLAGLRVGYAIGQPPLIEALDRVKDRAYFDETCGKVIATRTRLVDALSALGFDVLPSTANFVFARHGQHDGETLAAALRQRSIIVRHFSKPARIAPFLRITVGTDAQCEALLAALRAILT